jgi:regulator of extracellular matrix RemA (YlzA/DUF370 family)
MKIGEYGVLGDARSRLYCKNSDRAVGGTRDLNIKLANIGFGNIVAANRIIAIVSPESAPIKRIIQEAREQGMLVDATYGRRTRAVIITDSDHVILSAVQPETVAHRLTSKEVVAESAD